MTADTSPTPLVTAALAGHELRLRINAPRLDLAVADAARAAMTEAIRDHRGPVVIDLAAVDYIDSSGIGALVSLRKRLPGDSALRLADPSDFVLKILQITGLDRVFVVTA